MSNSNSRLSTAVAAIKVAEDSLLLAREEATVVLRASRPGLEILRASVNRARKQEGIGMEEAIGRLRMAEAVLLGPAMAKLAAVAKTYAEAAEALAAATRNEVVPASQAQAAK